MPWKETCSMDQRVRFVEAVRSELWSISELCREFGISRKTGYKWARRAEEEGLAGLGDRSRARLTQSHRTTDEARAAIIAARRKHPTWGPKKLLPRLRAEQPELVLPGRSTASLIINGAGLSNPQRPRRRLKHGTGGLGGDESPNGVWATDFKGQHRLEDKKYCYPLTVTDSHSRYLLACRGYLSICGVSVQKVFRRLFRTYGVPDHIRSDNGIPFASTGAGRLTTLSVFWIDQGIELQRITPGRPQQNGRHERMHRTLNEETTMPIAPTLAAQQRRYDRFRPYYNEDRPHEALDFACPADLYRPSTRAYVEIPAAPEYPSHYMTRKVQQNGSIKLLGHRPYISECLTGRRVGLVEVEEAIWQVYYRHHPVGTLDTSGKRIRIIDIWAAGSDA